MKRVLATVLAVGMLVGTMPAAFASETTLSETIVSSPEYVFSYQALGLTSTTSMYDISEWNIDRSISSGEWYYVTGRSQLSGSPKVSNGEMYTVVSNSNAILGTNVLALKIVVDENGAYIPTLNYKSNQNYTSKIHMFLVPAETHAEPKSTELSGLVEEALTSQTTDIKYIFKGHNMQGENNVYQKGTGAVVELSAGVYYLLISLEKVETNQTTSYAYLKSLKFTKTELMELTDIEAEFNAYIGNKLPEPEVTWLSDGKEITDIEKYNDSSVEWKITDNSEGAIVQKESGEWWAVKEGTAKAEVIGTFRGVKKTCETTIEVKEDMGLSGVNQSFLFTSTAYSDTKDTKFTAETPLTKKIFIDKYPYRDYGEERPWGLIAATASRSAGTYFSMGASYFDPFGKSNDWLAFKVKVPAPGRYRIDVSGYISPYSALTQIYMLPYAENMDWDEVHASIDEYTADENKVAAVDFYDAKSKVVRFDNVGEFTADASLDYSKGYTDYLMVVKAAERNTSDRVLLSGIYLEGKKGVASAKATLTDEEIGVGEMACVKSITALHDNGEEIDLDAAHISYEVMAGSEGVLKLGDDGKSVIALAEGEGTLLTNIYLNSKITTVESKIKVNNVKKAKKAILYTSSLAQIGSKIKGEAKAELADGTIKSGAVIRELIVAEQSEEGTVAFDSNGTVIVKKSGWVKLYARVNFRGNEFETEPVTVRLEVGEQKPISYMFLRSAVGFDEDIKRFDAVKNYDVLDREVSTGAWAHETSVGIYNEALGSSGSSYFVTNNSSTTLGTNALVLKFHVEEDGAYIPKLWHVPQSNSQSKLNLFIVSENDYKSSSAKDLMKEALSGDESRAKYVVRNADNYTENTAVSVRTCADGTAVELTAGTHYFLLAIDGYGITTNANGMFYSYVESIELLKTELMELTDIEVGFDAYIGNKLPKPTVKWLSSGAEITDAENYADCSISFEITENNDGALVEMKNGEWWVIKEGKVKAKVSATLRGVTKECDVTFNTSHDTALSGANQEYVFTTTNYSDTTANPTFSIATPLTEEIFNEKFSYRDYGTERPWGLIAAKVTRSTNKYFDMGASYMNTYLQSGDWMAFKVKVPAAGRYSVDLKGYQSTSGAAVAVYMLPYEETMDWTDIYYTVDAYSTSNNLVGTADLYGTEAKIVRRENIGEFIADESLDYSAGFADYLMLIKVSERTNKDTLYLTGVYLEGESGVCSSDVQLTDDLVSTGESVSVVSVTAKYDNGDAVNLDNAYVYYEIADGSEGILALSDDGKTVKTTAEGKGVFLVHICMNSKVTTIEKTITVTDGKKAERVYLYTSPSALTGYDIVCRLGAQLSDGSIINDGKIEEYIIVEQSEDGVAVMNDSGTALLAAKEGTVSFKARVTFRGNEYITDVVTVKISDEGYIYPASFNIDFRKVYDGDEYDLLADITKYSPTRNWVFYDFVGAAVQNVSIKDKSNTHATFTFKTSGDRYVAFKVKFPTSGTYTVDTYGSGNYRCGVMDMYLVPSTKENRLNLLSLLNREGEYYFGSADFYNVLSLSTGHENTFGSAEVKSPGEYLVVFKIAGNSSRDVWLPRTITFTNEDATHSASLSVKSGEAVLPVGETAELLAQVCRLDGTPIENGIETAQNVVYASDDENIATVSADGIVTGINEGEARISVTVIRDGTAVAASCDISVRDTSGIEKENGISVNGIKDIFAYAQTKLTLSVLMNSGKTVEIPSKYITWNVTEGSEYVSVSEDGIVTGIKTGEAVIVPQINPVWKDGIAELTVPNIKINVIRDATVNPQIFTLEERENVKKNVEKYDWAKSEAKSVASVADKYVENIDKLYEMVVPEGLPRNYYTGHQYDPQMLTCRYCRCDINTKYGSYKWVQNPLQRPWKIQCPDCKRLFPSNDFEKFYELGVTESKVWWSYEQALQKHHEMFVCEDVKKGEECTHTGPIENAPEPGSSEWMENDPRNAEWYEFYGYGVEGGYLNNDLYKELDTKLGVKGWGVDDGFGYRQPYVSDPKLPGFDSSYFDGGDGYARYANGPVQHTYIGFYLHNSMWQAWGAPNAQVLKDAIVYLRDAYLYTGEAKYGRAGAILLDRIADCYPSWDWHRWYKWRGYDIRGAMVDAISVPGFAAEWAEAYDAFLPIYNDPYVVEYLSARGAIYESDEHGNFKRDENGNPIPINLKDSPGALRKNIEDNILIETFKKTKRGETFSNFPGHQKAVVASAVALNRLPETKEMLDWVVNPSELWYNTGDYKGDIEGGYLLEQLICEVDRDGHGTEAAPGYNKKWVTKLLDIAEYLDGNDFDVDWALFENAKFAKMFAAPIYLTLGGNYTAQIGDSGGIALAALSLETDSCIKAFQLYGYPILAQAIYEVYGGEVEGVHGSIFDENPDIAAKVGKIIEEYGELKLGSDMLTGYGFAALRAGSKNNSANSQNATNTHRDFAIYFGTGTSHGHADELNLFASAFGLNIAPDHGYPEATGSNLNRYQWHRTTISHNTVVVDEGEQIEQSGTRTPLHFDDSGRVKLMDISANEVYPQTDEYRRSFFMIEVNDEISYGVDFFHVKGGEDHLYSFHSQSDELTAVSGLSDMEETPMFTDEKGNLYGTYAGANVMFGDDPGGREPNNIYPLGYTWLKNVRTFNSIEKNFTVEYKVKDWNKTLPDNPDIRLRLTMVNDEPMSEVAFANALPTKNESSQRLGELSYLLVRNKGENLDTTFTTVYEPYKIDNQYIESIEKVPMIRNTEEKPGISDSYGAVKVTLNNGRIDYVIYSTNEVVNYVVDNKIDFRGFAGVISFETLGGQETIVYRYLNDAEVLKLTDDIKTSESLAAYTGTVKEFTDDLAWANYIIYTPSAGQNVDVTDLAGRYVYVDNDGKENGAYKILSAEPDGTDIRLNIGDVTLVRTYADLYDYSKGYEYNIAVGQSLSIPLSVAEDSSPVFEPVANASTSARSSITIPIKVESPVGKDITLIGTTLPRGMTLDAEQMTLTWKPTSSQIGENHVAITADDGTLSKTLHFSVMVYGATTGSSSQDEDNTGSVDSTDTPSGGGGGGGGGGAAPAPDTEDTGDDTKPEDDETTNPDDGEDTPVGEGVPALPSKGFVDLGEYAWAADSINSLTDEGIIKGTTENTYSPALNITRADFALLLVRAFKLESDNTENFADVAESDYFARELAIARNCGIVGGIGDNKYAPRNTITRQDMMVIVYRALKALGVELVTDKVDYPDFDKVAPYARDAVEALITSGLVNGKNNMIAPTDYTTRAEVAVLLKRILEYTKQ